MKNGQENQIPGKENNGSLNRDQSGTLHGDDEAKSSKTLGFLAVLMRTVALYSHLEL